MAGVLGDFLKMLRMCGQGDIALDHQRKLESSADGQSEPNVKQEEESTCFEEF